MMLSQFCFSHWLGLTCKLQGIVNLFFLKGHALEALPFAKVLVTTKVALSWLGYVGWIDSTADLSKLNAVKWWNHYSKIDLQWYVQLSDRSGTQRAMEKIDIGCNLAGLQLSCCILSLGCLGLTQPICGACHTSGVPFLKDVSMFGIPQTIWNEHQCQRVNETVLCSESTGSTSYFPWIPSFQFISFIFPYFPIHCPQLSNCFGAKRRGMPVALAPIPSSSWWTLPDHPRELCAPRVTWSHHVTSTEADGASFLGLMTCFFCSPLRVSICFNLPTNIFHD